MKSIITQAIIEGCRSKKDRSLSLTISTPQLSPQEKAVFFEMQGINVDIKITPRDEEDVPEQVITKEIDQKTPSQRQRFLIYAIWKNQGSEEAFSIFYEKMMDKIANGLKTKYLEEYP